MKPARGARPAPCTPRAVIIDRNAISDRHDRQRRMNSVSDLSIRIRDCEFECDCRSRSTLLDQPQSIARRPSHKPQVLNRPSRHRRFVLQVLINRNLIKRRNRNTSRASGLPARADETAAPCPVSVPSLNSSWPTSGVTVIFLAVSVNRFDARREALRARPTDRAAPQSRVSPAPDCVSSFNSG